MLVIIAPNGRRVEFNDVTGSGIVGHKTIRIFDSNVTFGVLQARSIGELRAADPMKLSGETTTRMIIEGQPTWRADSSFDGTLDKLPLTLKLFEPFRADVRGELLTLSKDFHWTGKADVHNFDLQAFGGGSALGIITRPARCRRRDERVPRARPADGARASAAVRSTSCSKATTRITW